MDNSDQNNMQDNVTFTFDDNGSIVDDTVAMADTSSNVRIETPGDPTSASTIQANTDSEYPETGMLSTNTEQAVLSATDDQSSRYAQAASEQSDPVVSSSGSSTVDVSVGGGMIEVIAKAKGISMAEAEQVYYSMKSKGQIYGIPGTYDMNNQDIGISAPGAFVVGEDLMADIDAASGNTSRPEQDTSDVLGQTDRPQEAATPASGADSESPVSGVRRDGISVDSAPRSIIDTRISPFPNTPNEL